MKDKLLKLNIQLFAEEDVDDMAANEVDDDVESTDDTDAGVNEDTTPIDKTKAFSERLKTKTAEIEKSYQDKLDAVAKQQGFDSWEELEEASDKQAMNDLGVEDEEKFQALVNKAIEKNPDVIKDREIVRQNEEANKQREIDDQLKMINKLDNSIKTMEDLAKQENVQEIIDKVNKGYSLFDAYITANRGKELSNILDSARKNAAADLSSKSHLKPSSGAAGKDTFVPDDIYATYKRNMPNWTDEQIRKHYAKTMKEEK